MTQELEKRPKKFLKDRILRYKPVVFIRKNLFLFTFITIFLITLLLGVWDIKRHEVYDLDGNELDYSAYSKIEQYIEENIFGRNYFVFSPSTERRNMYLNIPVLESVRIEKVIPNKVILFVEVYEPKYSAFLKNGGCNILSTDGVVLDAACEDLEKDCCREYSVDNSLIFFSSPDVEVSSFENEKDRLLILEEVEKVVTVVEAFQYKVETIKLENDILGVRDDEGRLFTFTIADDIATQLKGFIVVVGKIKSEHIDFSSLDLRFERPVMVE